MLALETDAEETLLTSRDLNIREAIAGRLVVFSGNIGLEISRAPRTPRETSRGVVRSRDAGGIGVVTLLAGVRDDIISSRVVLRALDIITLLGSVTEAILSRGSTILADLDGTGGNSLGITIIIEDTRATSDDNALIVGNRSVLLVKVIKLASIWAITSGGDRSWSWSNNRRRDDRSWSSGDGSRGWQLVGAIIS